MYDAIVVGGGIVGLSAAYHLVKEGAKTLLVDRFDAGQATAAGAGILSPQTSSIQLDGWFDLALPAVAYYPQLVKQLAAEGAGETGYAPMQELIVAVSPDEDERFAQAYQRMLDRQKQRNAPAPDDLSVIDAATAQSLFPPLASVRSALHIKYAGRVDGRLMAAALQKAAEQRGLVVRRASVEQLALANGVVNGVIVDDETIAAGAVIIAAGAWAAQFSESLSINVPIKPQRGQIIHLSLPEVDTGSWPIVSPFHGHYMVPWPDGRIVVGATRELESGFAPHTTAAGVHEVLGEALRVAPGLATATIAEIRIGLRPATPDNLPLLGPIPNTRNVYIAAGHGATGLQLGPYSGKLIADLALGRSIDIDLTAFAADRFS